MTDENTEITIGKWTGYPSGKCWECGSQLIRFSWIGTTVLQCTNQDCGQSDEYEEE